MHTAEKQVILLNGPSSSGKSTLAKALQGLIREKQGENYAIVSIDDFMKISTNEKIYEDDVFEISGELCQAAETLLETAPGVIIDHVITSARIFDDLAAQLHPFRLYRVRVTCPLQVLRQREKARGDRFIGSAESSLEYLYPKDGYDLTVDTGKDSASECARQILAGLTRIRIASERFRTEEYIDFLRRSDLGSQYPKERFEERIERLLRSASVSLSARDANGRLAGVLLGLTDFAYWLYITDLGVDRDYEKQGIGTRLMKTALALAGGERDIAVYLIANENAVGFYEKLGMEKADEVMRYNHIDWTPFTV